MSADLFDWRDFAGCKGSDPELFFPLASDEEHLAAAVAVCDACPVSEQCFEFALATRQQFGVWGGRLLDGYKHPKAVRVREWCGFCGERIGSTDGDVVRRRGTYCSSSCDMKAYRQRRLEAEALKVLV